MAKKQKGKQKQDEPTIINNQTKDEQVNVPVVLGKILSISLPIFSNLHSI